MRVSYHCISSCDGCRSQAGAASDAQRSDALSALVSAHAAGPAWPEGPPIGLRQTEHAELEV